MEALAILCGLLIAGFFAVKSYRNQQMADVVNGIIRPSMQQLWLNDRFRAIFAHYGVEYSNIESAENRLLRSASEFAQLIVKEAVNGADRQIDQLNDDELFAAMIIGFVASDYISQTIQSSYSSIGYELVQYEDVSMVACGVLGLLANKPPEDVGAMIHDVGQEVNALQDSSKGARLLQGIGDSVLEFLQTGEVKPLEKLSLFYRGLVQSIVRGNA